MIYLLHCTGYRELVYMGFISEYKKWLLGTTINQLNLLIYFLDEILNVRQLKR